MEETEAIEEPTEEADGKLEETPFQTAVLEAYFKGGATPEQIAINMRVDERDIEEILCSYAKGSFKTRHFCPALHDRIVDFAMEHPDMPAMQIGTLFHLRYGAANHIINGRNYNGFRYTREQLAERWKAMAAETKKKEPAPTVNEQLAQARADLNKLLGIVEEYREQIVKYHAFERAILAAVRELHIGDGAEDAEAEVAD